MKILVVDDIEPNVYQLQVLLAGNGYTVETAPNGAAALEQARRSPPDLIITDILMPVMDGFSLCREWMQDERLKRVPLVFYTATYTDERDRKLALGLGAAQFIVKPEEPEILLRTIQTVLEERKDGTAAAASRLLPDDLVYLKEYNEALIRKLEGKMRQLEQTNRDLERDIAGRKVAERQLREQNEILFWSREGVMIVDLANTISFWNHGAEEIFGWPSAEAVGRDPVQVLGVDDPVTISALLAAIDRDGYWNGELRAKSRQGKILIVDCRITLVRDEADQPRARLIFVADVTEKRLLEQKLFHVQRLESIGMLAAGIAHDLNNVLTPIVVAAPMLRESLSAPSDLKILDVLEQSAGRGVGLVKQILGFAHSTAGDFQPTQVKHLARDIITVIEQTFPKAIRLEHKIPSDLPLVHGNATQIHQVLLNLCVNARDAMPQGGVLCLTASARRLGLAEAATMPGARPGAWLVIEVADTGTGIAPDVLERIWDPFFTTKGVGKGTGLGLSTVRAIVASHHGFVTLETRLNFGSTFRVFLPTTLEEGANNGSASAYAMPAGSGELILVVDDEAAVRETIAAILTKNGYRVLGAKNGVEAVGHFTAHAAEIALVVSDVDMPNVGGVALGRILAQLRPEIRLLLISGLSHGASGTASPEAAHDLVHAFLHKPFTHEVLLKTVRELLFPAVRRRGQAGSA